MGKPDNPREYYLRHRAAFFAIGTLILFVIVTLPFTLNSAFQDVFGSPEREVYTIPAGPESPEKLRHSHVRIVIAALDELEQLATMNVYLLTDLSRFDKMAVETIGQ